jgi:ABC-type branched-subunit amino acid transport system substrate-binding protein
MTRLRWKKLAMPLLAAVVVAGACSSEGDEDLTGSTTSEPVPTSGVESSGSSVATEAAPPWSIDQALAADPNCAEPVTGEPLRIGYAADFTEIGGVADRPGSEAALHLARLVNCSGGVDGQPVEVLVVDVSGTPLESRQAVMGLVDSGVSAIIGPPFPDPGFRILQVTDGQIPVLFASSTEPALANLSELSFLVAFNDTLGASSAAQFALDQGWRTAVTFSAPGPYFGYNPVVFAEAFEAGGGTVTADYGYVPAETVDFSAEVAEMAAAGGPDVIYSAMFANQIAALRSQLMGANLTAEFIGSDAFEATGGYFTAGVDGVYHVTHAFSEPGSRIAAFEESYRLGTGSPSENPTFAALAADAMTVILDAYARSGKGPPEVIGATIAEGTGVQAVTGVLSYNGAASPAKPVYIHRVVDGQATLADVAQPREDP